MGEPPCYAHLVDENGQIREVPAVRIRRVYEAEAEAGVSGEARVLVDRIWPRGIAKQRLRLDRWARELAPSDDLRRWFGHDPSRWLEFRQRYRAELAESRDQLEGLAALARQRPLVLLYSARDQEHNQAAVLREVIEEVLER